MIYISHRGNLKGANPNLENNPAQVKSCLAKGLHCEIDVWFINGHFFLGHDGPVYAVKEKFLENKKLWCHAKNLSALEKMSSNSKIHSFWHETDQFTLTSKGYIWTFPDRPVCAKSIIVKLNRGSDFNPMSEPKCYGICSDYLI